jgi:HSP20 family protein
MLTLFNPWRSLASDLDWFAQTESNGNTFAPRVDIVERPDHYSIDVDLPGVDAKDVSVTVEHNVLTIAGERKLEKEEKREGYVRFERSHGSFCRSFQLPEDVDPEHITAAGKNGVLTVQLPKAAKAKPRAIEVKMMS